MSNPSEPDEGVSAPDGEAGDEEQRPDAAAVDEPPSGDPAAEPAHDSDPATEVMAVGDHADHEPETEVFASATPPPPPVSTPGERRFTAPSGFDAGRTQKMESPAEPATEIISMSDSQPATAPAAALEPKTTGPQVIPPREDAPKPPSTNRRSWGWVIAVVLIIAALVALAVLGTLLLTRNSEPAVSQEDEVRATIQNFDVAVQKGDLPTLRSITCGTTRDDYVRYNDTAWADTHEKVAAAKQYPVVASIDQVVVNGEHAEANVTTFMAYAPQTRSTRSFDLQFLDNQWKICQAPQ